MKKHHHKTLKFHTLFTCILIVACAVVLVLKPDWLLGISCALLIVYVAGNGIIHTRKNELSRDALLEYALVATIAGLIIVGAVLR